ncbi:hypothetical protein EZV62_012152 [Acer yangbiense]|uniref:Calcineurin-like phosphoesterase domain-containing protein n=1 Tax=Acer yangbiense TaxID=1000413 RepID=A0A5C7HVM4_9ROSI|nr:hypothetical protein EZV62_012152 [Acer yangbiense]
MLFFISSQSVNETNLQASTHPICSSSTHSIYFNETKGDFGNENVELVRSVADLEFPKAVILGNHDSWKTQQFSGKRKDGVQLQLEW